MRLLIDNALSPVVARELERAGYDVVHVRDLGMAKSPDTVIMQHAFANAPDGAGACERPGRPGGCRGIRAVLN